MKPAELESLLRSRSMGAFQFHHGVVRDVLYRRLGLLDKTKWHWAAGDASAHSYDAGSIDDSMIAAEHWVRGVAVGDVDAAVAWLTRTARSLWISARGTRPSL